MLYLNVRTSADGGRAWSAPAGVPVTSPLLRGNGVFPVVRPNGDLLLVFSVYGSLDPSIDAVLATRSLDGGATFETARSIAPLLTEDIAGIRAPPFVSADVDSTGTVYVAWSDCRFNAQCTANGIVLTTSRDGVSWTQPRPVPFGPAQLAVDRFVPALAVDPLTAGSSARLAIVAYAATQAQGCHNCELVDALLIESTDGGLSWGAPQRLTAESMRLPWIAETNLGRMLADYVSVSFVGGRPVPVFPIAAEPEAGEFRQAVFATTRVR